LSHKRIIHYTTFDPKKRANAAFLIAAYSVRGYTSRTSVKFELLSIELKVFCLFDTRNIDIQKQVIYFLTEHTEGGGAITPYRDFFCTKICFILTLAVDLELRQTRYISKLHSIVKLNSHGIEGIS
jgi:hypothetical protein